MGQQPTLTGLLESLDSSADTHAESNSADDRLSIGEVLPRVSVDNCLETSPGADALH